MTNEQYIEHEVKLRTFEIQKRLDEKSNDKEHRELRDMLKEMRTIYRVTMGAFATAIVVPVILHYFNLI